MLELIVLAGVIIAEAAGEDAAAVFPHPALTLDAFRVAAGAGAGVALQALPPVTHPRLTATSKTKIRLLTQL
jgi:hypothetical protein